MAISGRGVVSGSAFPFLRDPSGFCHTAALPLPGSFCWSLVNMDNGASHRLEGLVLHDPPKFHFRSYAPSVAVLGVKLLGAWTPNSDGVVVGAAGSIKDSYIRSSDDSIKLFGSGSEVADCVVWQGVNGAVFQLGWWMKHDYHSIIVSRVTVLHADWQVVAEGWSSTHATNDAVFDLRGPGGGTPLPPGPHHAGLYNISNITWRGVVVDSPIQGGGLFRMNLSAANGTVSALSFDRLRIPSAMGSSFALTPEQWIGGLRFDDFSVGGSCVHNVSAAGFSPSPASATFSCSTPLHHRSFGGV